MEARHAGENRHPGSFSVQVQNCLASATMTKASVDFQSTTLKPRLGAEDRSVADNTLFAEACLRRSLGITKLEI
ncbi:MAG TPA: hypothetical protein VF977_10790, partial [Candidatus Binatia bacterium]